MKLNLQGKVAIVTGGTQGIGRATAEMFAAEGASVVIVARGLERLNAVVAGIHKGGGKAFGVQADMAKEADAARVIPEAVNAFGRVDILVNNAANNPKVEDGAQNFARLETFPLEQWNADVAVGLTGAFLCAKIFGTAMAQAKRGVIINISSEYGMIAPDQRLYRIEGEREDRQPVKPVTYTIVKAGLHGLTIYLFKIQMSCFQSAFIVFGTKLSPNLLIFTPVALAITWQLVATESLPITTPVPTPCPPYLVATCTLTTEALSLYISSLLGCALSAG